MATFGVDLSSHRGKDFPVEKLKTDAGVQFAILRIGGSDAGYYKDRYFERYYAKCKSAGIPVGSYYFGHCMSLSDADKEADHIISLLKAHQFEYPFFYDVEADMLTLSKSKLTDIVLHICDKVEKAGYWVGIYMSQYTFNNEVDDLKLRRFSHWVAKWGTKVKPTIKYGGDVQVHQYECSEKIFGQPVDKDLCYVDYPKLIKKKHLNGF